MFVCVFCIVYFSNYDSNRSRFFYRHTNHSYVDQIGMTTVVKYQSLPYYVLQLVGIQCDVGRGFCIDGKDKTTTACNYSEQGGERLAQRTHCTRRYCRGYRRYVCDRDEKGFIGFCCVCGNYIRSPDTMKESKLTFGVQSLEVGIDVKRESELFVCGGCRKTFPTEPMFQLQKLKELKVGTDVLTDKTIMNVVTLLNDELIVKAPKGLSPEISKMFITSRNAWGEVIQRISWTEELFITLRPPKSLDTATNPTTQWLNKYSHFSNQFIQLASSFDNCRLKLVSA